MVCTLAADVEELFDNRVLGCVACLQYGALSQEDGLLLAHSGMDVLSICKVCALCA